MPACFTTRVLLSILLPLIGNAQIPPADALSSHASLVLYDPRPGFCTLIVRAEGSAAILFGASPRRAAVPAGTFNLDTVHTEFEARRSAENRAGYPALDANTLSASASDEAARPEADFIRSLLEQAWKAREEPATAIEAEDHRFVQGVCGF